MIKKSIINFESALPYLLGLGALILYKATMAPGLTWGDSGEFISSAYTLGIGHPYGHPLYWLSGRVMTLFFPDDSVRALNNLSVLAGAITCFFVALLARDWVQRAGNLNLILPVTLTTLIFATGTVFWSQAIFTEVYTFHAMFFVISIYCFDRFFFGKADISYLYLSAYFWGLTLTLGMYVTLVLIVPLVHILSDAERRREIIAHLHIAFFWFLIGLTPWIYLYARSQADPPLTINSLTSLADYLDYLSRKAYDEVIVAGFGGLGISIRQTLTIFYDNLQVVGILAVIVLMYKGYRSRGHQSISTRTLAALLTALVFALMIPLTLSFRQMIDMDVYFIPVLIIFIPSMAIGIALLIQLLRSRFIPLILIILILIPIFLKFDSITMSKSRMAIDFAEYLKFCLPAHSKVMSVSDEVTYVLMYRIYCQGNPEHIELMMKDQNKNSNPLGDLGTASLSDYLEIDEKYINLPSLFRNSSIAGPFMVTHGETTASQLLESEFIRRFSIDPIAKTSVHRYDRIFLAQIWARRGYFWLKRSAFSDNTPSYTKLCIDNSINCYRQAFLLDDFTFEGASHAGNLAIALVRNGLIEEAEQLTIKALNLNSHAEAPWRARLTIALKREQFDDALKVLEHLLQYSSNTGEIWLDMATLYFYKLNLPDEARHAYQNGIYSGGVRRANLESALNQSGNK